MNMIEKVQSSLNKHLVAIWMLTNLLERDTKELSSTTESLNCLREYLNHHAYTISRIMDIKGVC